MKPATFAPHSRLGSTLPDERSSPDHLLPADKHVWKRDKPAKKEQEANYLVTLLHNPLQLRVDLLRAPLEPLTILRHL